LHRNRSSQLCTTILGARVSQNPSNTYTATITFTNADTGQGTRTRTATLTVNPAGLIVTPTTGIAASGQQGGRFSPTSFSYSLSAASGSVKYTITNVPSGAHLPRVRREPDIC
jgi:hypothetical protein